MAGWLRVKDAQEYCGVSERTIHNWLHKDGLKHSKVNGTILIKSQDIDELIERHQVSESVHEKANKIIQELLS